MKIIVAGTGFVGLTHAAVISEYGHEVYTYDIDEQKLDTYRSADRNRIGQYVNEVGLPEIIAETKDRSLFFTSALKEVIEGVEAIFLCLPTPPNLDGSSNLSFYFQAIEHLCALLARRNDTRRVVLINKSTVPIGTVCQLAAKLREYAVPNVGVASNPEFYPKEMQLSSRGGPLA
ncbi:MAG: UDP-glucose/GDP-mannose dehydrogenase family protein [Chloroflexi bacterium AL-W]|nr:UDP-glucose/GDP-mannose dehydrogenase family protein [Chloroflexi bacterium AL-N1]NOK68341.1 UDP-glucose/GDP-mannose dehydrogenase family protein [Chloroflexi bacterium AL-N10]NOK73987.1 UDP-glucose/GDP-mannose dehydrogenase family protein [Chloroflexi bacterium AL-N5]NOK82955.1 UDP-glucose/GDP-mannose dehydrogenase family protein [Chloroflexi bacterium AL-W]NOK90477.1 UDP-glucose/GDP-mannose dehydrogenase family protein [Chloroflexi bacterium AL-N15]